MCGLAGAERCKQDDCAFRGNRHCHLSLAIALQECSAAASGHCRGPDASGNALLALLQSSEFFAVYANSVSWD